MRPQQGDLPCTMSEGHMPSRCNKQPVQAAPSGTCGSGGKQRLTNPSCGEVYRVFAEMDSHRSGLVTKAQFEEAAVELGMRPGNIEHLFSR